MSLNNTFKLLVSRRFGSTNLGFFTFQGHGVNNQGSSQCHCHDFRQRRQFFNVPKADRTKQFWDRQLIGYSIQQMYEVVADVDSYQKFLPWCTKSTVLSRGPGQLKANLVIFFPPIEENYTSNVTLIEPNLVRAVCTDGKVFKHLSTTWRFSPGLKKEPNSCIIDFRISFEFKSVLHSHVANLFFDQLSKQMQKAFINEVARRHGPARIAPRNLLVN